MMLGERKGWKAYANFLLVRLQRKRKSIRCLGRPYTVVLDPSSYCNLRCPFCPTGQRNQLRSYATLPLERFKHLIQELGDYLFYLELFNWGEPFFNKDLIPMIEHIRPFGIYSNVSTNFDIKLSEELAERIVSSGLSRLIISADGTSQESYEKYRVGGRFENVLKNMKTVAAARRRMESSTPQIFWRFLVFRHNEHEIERARHMAEEMEVQLDLCAPYVALTDERFRDWIPTLPGFNKYAQVPGEAGQGPALPRTTKDGACDWLWMSAAINPGGSVSPCCGLWEERHDFGKLGAGGFREVWNNRTYRSARAFMKHGIPSGASVICEQCPVPDIWNTSSHYDPPILESLYRRVPFFWRKAVEHWVQEIFY